MTFYRMSGYEPGMYMEIYLPKKAIYQQFLFRILTTGFDIDAVRSHFLSGHKRSGILELLGTYSAWADYAAEYIQALRPCFFGYSMYEVDGVFKGDKTKSHSVVEERTQVIRMMFRIDLDELTTSSGVKSMDKMKLRAIACDYLRANNRQLAVEESEGERRQIIEATKKWRDQIGFFVFGYILYEICQNIETLGSAGSIPKTEDEIWVTNFANIELDRVLWRPS